MESDSEKLKSYRKKYGYSQVEFAQALGVTQATIAMLESGTRAISDKFKFKFLQAFKTDFDTMLVDFSRMTPEDLLNSPSVQKNNVSTPIPFYSAKASAGKGWRLSDYSDFDVLYFDTRWLKNVLGINPEHASLIHAKGDSMDSGQNKPDDIKSGDLLMVDDSAQEIINNKIFVIELNKDQLVVKRVVKEFNGTVLLLSNNPNYPARAITEADEARIIGRVVWNGSKENI